MMYEVNKAAVVARPVRSLLRCTSAQGTTLIRLSLGCPSQSEHGEPLRGSLHGNVQTPAIEMLHHRLSEETGDLRSDVPRQDSTPSVLQLHALAVRAYLPSGQLQLHQGQGNALRHQTSDGLLQEGVAELAEALLRDAPGYSRLLHAHRETEAAGDSHHADQENGRTQDQQALERDMVRRAGHRLHLLADGGDGAPGSEKELHRGRREGELDRAGSRQEYAEPCRRTGTADRKPHLAALLECVSESLRPVREAHAEMQVLRTIRGRRDHRKSRQGTSAFAGASDTAVPQRKAWAGSAHGKASGERGTQGHRVPRSIYQAIPHLRFPQNTGARGEEAAYTELQETRAGVEKREQLPWHIPAHLQLQHQAQAVHEGRISAYRSVR